MNDQRPCVLHALRRPTGHVRPHSAARQGSNISPSRRPEMVVEFIGGYHHAGSSLADLTPASRIERDERPPRGLGRASDVLPPFPLRALELSAPGGLQNIGAGSM